jgi:hypothetical protein
MTNLQKTFNAPSVQELDQLIRFCEVLAKAPFYAKMGAAGVLAIYLTAKEMNLPLMTCLNGGLYTFDGKVTMSSQLMNMMIINAGHQANVIKLDETICEIEFIRSDRRGEGARSRYSFSIEQAQKAGYLSKDVWRKHSRDMLFSRALSGGARKIMPDVIMNAYVFGELDDEPQIQPAITSSLEPIPDEITHQPCKAIDHVTIDENSPAYIEFIKAYNVQEGSPAMVYLQEVSKRGEMSFLSVIQASINHPLRFTTGLQKWADENNIPLTNGESK